MSAGCVLVRGLLDRRAAGLNEAERLVLERHLDTCADCTAQSALLAGLRSLSDLACERTPVPRERLIARAIDRAAHSESAPLPVSRRSKRIGSTVLAAVLAAALVLFATTRRARPPALGSSTSQILPRSQLISGAVASNGRALGRGDVIPEDAPLALGAASELALEHARVHAAEPSRGRWSATEASFSLEQGALEVSVDPRPKRPFSVRTSRFAVQVLGTEFRVSLSDVRVSRGLVRVLSPAGQELARVAAGESWQFTEATGTASSDPPRASAVPVEPSPTPSVADRLALARRALAARDLGNAKSLLGSVLAGHASRPERAEAQLLLADWARLSGDNARAAAEYLAVSTHFHGLPQAETALFSAARVEASAGNAARAQGLFTQYLAEYPQGQFRQEATLRLASPSSASAEPK